MCTTIANRQAVSGSGKGPQGWFPLDYAFIGYDHPTDAPFDHAVNIDFVNRAAGARIAVELSRESARALAALLIETLEAADAYEGG